MQEKIRDRYLGTFPEPHEICNKGVVGHRRGRRRWTISPMDGGICSWGHRLRRMPFLITIRAVKRIRSVMMLDIVDPRTHTDMYPHAV